jgi:hypothetical protein
LRFRTVNSIATLILVTHFPKKEIDDGKAWSKSEKSKSWPAAGL